MIGAGLNATFAAGFVHLFAVGLPRLLFRVMYLQWLLGLQLVVCLALGYLVSRKTRRALFECLAAAFLAAVVPVAGYAVMLAAYIWLPPLPTANACHSPASHPLNDQPPEASK